MNRQERNRRISEGLRLAWKRKKEKAMSNGNQSAESNVVTPDVVPWAGPQTHEEAACFNQGFAAGAMAYARDLGHSTDKTENAQLRRLLDEQGWKTIEEFERIANSVR